MSIFSGKDHGTTEDAWQMVVAPTIIDNGDGTNSWWDEIFSGIQRQYKIVVIYDE